MRWEIILWGVMVKEDWEVRFLMFVLGEKWRENISCIFSIGLFFLRLKCGKFRFLIFRCYKILWKVGWIRDYYRKFGIFNM